MTSEQLRAIQRKCGLAHKGNLRRGNGNPPWSKERTFFESIKRKHGISSEQWMAIFDAQEGKCFGCKAPQSRLSRRLLLDHCHKTGKVRGLLCNTCNLRISNLEKYKSIYQRLVRYLAQYDSF